jgi:hypothetical protein
MKVACKIFLGIALIPVPAFAQAAPEIQVIDGKVSMAVQNMPLSRMLSLLDRAMGLSSTVKPELSNQAISVRFTGLGLKEAVHKIFEGQPYNYMYVEGKGIRVLDRVVGGATASASSSSPFQDPVPINQPPQSAFPLQPGIQPANAVPLAGQPAAPTTPFGTPTNPPAATAPNTSNSGPAPGQLPPPIGSTNPLVNPVSAQPPTGAIGFPATGAGGFPATGAPPPPAQPAGPGTIPGAAPGTIGR